MMVLHNQNNKRFIDFFSLHAASCCCCQVGNDAVDQLTKFNGRLADMACRPNPHTIDGIVLTKMDTIDDKARLLVIMSC